MVVEQKGNIGSIMIKNSPNWKRSTPSSKYGLRRTKMNEYNEEFYDVEVYFFDDDNVEARMALVLGKEPPSSLGYFKVAFLQVKADSHEEALSMTWEACQNIYDSWHPQKIRSAMVGDIFAVGNENRGFTPYRVKGRGWEKLSNMGKINKVYNSKIKTARGLIENTDSKKIELKILKEEKVQEEKVENRKNPILEIEEEITVGNVILEKGDRIRVIESFQRGDQVITLETLYTPGGDIEEYTKGVVIEYDAKYDMATVEFDFLPNKKIMIKDSFSKLQRI